MAGAVSAGAYTAGVMDYLLETLERWEQAKARNRQTGKGNPGYDPSVPMHEVEISVLTGASAGGITTVVAAAALQNHIPHISPANRGNAQAKLQNKFYDTWVNMLAENMMEQLLDLSDIETEGLVALLNSSFKDKLAEKALKLQGELADRPYISKEMEILVTLSNLEGIPFQLGFRSGQKAGSYLTRWQRDYGHFRLGGGAYRHDGRIPVSFNGQGQHLQILEQAAKATGAFPVGLRSRKISRQREFVADNPFINPLHGTGAVLEIPEQYDTLNVDGGLLNNEPFDITRKIMFDEEDMDKQQHHQTFEGTILMIDPFPSEREEQKEKEGFSLLLNDVIPQIFGTMRSQLLFKEQDVEAAFDDDDYSRFLIAPKRGNILGSKAIACGSLEGFGGFFSKKFREHDFYLGRRNCQHFLRTFLGVPANTDNPLFKGAVVPEAAKRFGFECNGELMVPIIPDMAPQGGLTPEEKMPLEFSDIAITKNYLYALQAPVKARLRVILLAAGVKKLNWPLRKLFNLFFWLKGGKYARKLLEIVENKFRTPGLM